MNKVPDPVGSLSPERRELLERLRALQAQAAAEPIAVIGLGCRFPGSVTGPESYWRLLTAGQDAVTEVPRGRWDVDAWYSPDWQVAGKLSTRYGAFLDEIAGFDADFFGIAPREAVYIDPQHRLLLEVAWESLENAGIAPDSLQESATGVFVGLSTLDYYRRAFANPARLNPYCATGTFASAGAGRISYTLGLQGPSLAIDTACSSSLVAIHSACQSLRTRECEMALAGGVSLMVGPELGVSLSKAGMLAPDGRCKTFDASADGYGRGEGCGLVVLKRLADAQRDGDLIWGIIAGSAVNQDGRSNGLTAPNGRAQEALLRAALKSAAASPAEVAFLEAHGTGTALGDPIEVGALAAVLGAGRPRDLPLALGSVKTNIGHLEHAAGVAGLIKALLCLHHDQLVPNLHFREWNPQIAAVAGGVKLHVPTELEPWPSGQRRLAGVSSFGFGGTNAHVLLAAAPEAQVREAPVLPSRHVLCLSAKTPVALRELAKAYAQVFSETPESVGEICRTALTGRAQFECRLAIVADSARELTERLRQQNLSSDEHPSSNGTSAPGVGVRDATDPAEILARAYLSGGSFDCRQVYGAVAPGRKRLPTYPFQRTKYWLEDSDEQPQARSKAPRRNGANGAHEKNGAANGSHVDAQADAGHAPENGAASNGAAQNGTASKVAGAAQGASVSNGTNGSNGHASPASESKLAAAAHANGVTHANGKNGSASDLNGAAGLPVEHANGVAAEDPEHVRGVVEGCLIRVLELPEDRRILPDQDLGDLGMDSITALELLFAVEKTLSRPLRMPGIAKSRTINQFVAFIRGEALPAEPSPSPTVCAERDAQ